MKELRKRSLILTPKNENKMNTDECKAKNRRIDVRLTAK